MRTTLRGAQGALFDAQAMIICDRMKQALTMVSVQLHIQTTERARAIYEHRVMAHDHMLNGKVIRCAYWFYTFMCTRGCKYKTRVPKILES